MHIKKALALKAGDSIRVPGNCYSRPVHVKVRNVKPVVYFDHMNGNTEYLLVETDRKGVWKSSLLKE